MQPGWRRKGTGSRGCLDYIAKIKLNKPYFSSPPPKKKKGFASVFSVNPFLSQNKGKTCGKVIQYGKKYLRLF